MLPFIPAASMSFETEDSFLTVMGHPMFNLPLVDVEVDEETGKTLFSYAELIAMDPTNDWTQQQVTWTPLRLQVRRRMKEQPASEG
jgi:hypothetical protein